MKQYNIFSTFQINCNVLKFFLYYKDVVLFSTNTTQNDKLCNLFVLEGDLCLFPDGHWSMLWAVFDVATIWCQTTFVAELLITLTNEFGETPVL